MAQTVTVKSGDTLSGIASQYGVKVGDITGYSSGNPNLIYPGEVLSLSNVGSSVNATDIKPTVNMNLPNQSSQQTSGTSSLFNNTGSISSQVDKYRKELDKMISSRKNEVDSKLNDLRKKENDTLGKVETLTQPFREDLEKTERERLNINKNFEENQKLIDELDKLLTEGNNLVTQQQQVTGLASVRNPRIQKTMDDVASRAGVIEAVINARNGQITVAENLIDRSINAISADRQDQLSYYQTVLELNRQDIVSLDAESKKMADAQISLIESDLQRAQKTADYVKQLLVDPATASLMAEAGVSLKDSVESINTKLSRAVKDKELRDFVNENVLAKGGIAVTDPSSVPADQLVTYKDPYGTTRYYKVPRSGNSTSAASKEEAAFDNAVMDGIAQLKSGENWGTVWERIHSKFPDVPALLIDAGLGAEWKSPGAYEAYAKKQQDAKF